ncbi:MAG: FtsX-like permease family protein [candidate division WOR-3 bacterium]
MILKLAYRNFLRNTRRSIISALSIAIAITLIIFVQSYLRGILINISDNVIKLVAGHIRITTLNYERQERLLPLSEAIELSPDFMRLLQREEILYIAPRIKFGVLLGQDELSIPSLGYAIDAETEKKFSGLDKRVIQGAYLDNFGNSVVLGRELARRLNLQIGDTLTIITRTVYDSPTGINLVVQGIFSTGIGGMDRNIFYIPLKVGQRMLDLENRATEIAIILKNPRQSIKIAREIQSQSNYRAVPYQYNQLLKYINSITPIFSIIYIIILIVACSTIANTMIMVVYERVQEIGMLKALGLSDLSIVKLLTCEAGIIGLLGSFIGSVGGSILSYWLKYQGLDLRVVSSTASFDLPYGPIIYFAPTPLLVTTAFWFGLISAIFVGLIPILKVVKLEPAQALRTIT